MLLSKFVSIFFLCVVSGFSMDICYFPNVKTGGQLRSPSYNYLARLYNFDFNITTQCEGEIKLYNEYTCCLDLITIFNKVNKTEETLNNEIENKTEKEKIGESGIRPILISSNNVPVKVSNDCGDKCCPEKLLPEIGAKCPDGNTIYELEPRCKLYMMDRIDSGKCPQEGGICHKGYCCPSVNLQLKKLGRKPYISAMECSPRCEIPSKMLFAFCEPSMKKIAFFGTEKQKSSRSSGINSLAPLCETTIDCKDGFVCVNTQDMNGNLTRGCFENPMLHLEAQQLSIFVIPSIGAAFLFLLFYIQMQVLVS